MPVIEGVESNMQTDKLYIFVPYSVLILESRVFFLTDLFLACRKLRRPPRWNWELEPLIPIWMNGWRYISGHELELHLEMRAMMMSVLFINSLLLCRVLHLRREANRRRRSRCETPENSLII
jgi:hypothetical protein